MIAAILAPMRRRSAALEAALDAREDAWEKAFWGRERFDDAYPPCPDDVRQWVRVKRQRELRAAVQHVWAKGQRDEEWTLRRAIMATIACYLGREWGDTHAHRWRDRHPIANRAGERVRPLYVPSTPLCYWNSHSDGYGYSFEYLSLHPGLRVSLDHDGESFL